MGKKRREETLRMTRTKKLLWCIGIVFLLCWIPINFINLLSDSLLLLNMSLLSLLKTEWFYLAFTFCHCSAMVCPVINPVIYGFFNENFKREFLQLKNMVCKSGQDSYPNPGPNPQVTQYSTSVQTNQSQRDSPETKVDRGSTQRDTKSVSAKKKQNEDGSSLSEKTQVLKRSMVEVRPNQ